jgi:hypothetical protein
MHHRSKLPSFRALAALATTLACATAASAEVQIDAYRAQGIEPAKVLNGTVLVARVLPGDDKQVVAMTTHFTGKREAEGAVNVRLDVFRQRDGKLFSIFTRDFGAETGTNVSGGDLEIVDLDLDGTNDLVVSWDAHDDPLIDRRLGEVIVHDGSGFRTAWSGVFEYDATRAARKVAPERRDRFVREIDIESTMRSRGAELVVKKTVLAVAGERLGSPKTVEESFPLR